MTHNPSSNHLYKLVMRIAVLALISVLPGATGVVTGQRLAEDPRIFGGPERKLYNSVPTKLPLAFDVQNVTSEKWVHELEIEVTNISDKPIYYMDMYVFLVGVKFQGANVGFWLKYGRVQLKDFSEPLLPEDVPIKPGEKHTFKISESDAKGWDTLKVREGKAEPRFLKLYFQQINFGDGTGFGNNTGRPINIHQKVSRAGPSRLEPRFDSYPQIGEHGPP
ncbi:MAG: hypothetical protein ACREBG_30315 [Pyrinomonadaceae bacterium]